MSQSPAFGSFNEFHFVHREEDGEASERSERPNEEEAAVGISNVRGVRSSYVHDGHSCREQPGKQHDDVPQSSFAENERSMQKITRTTSAIFAGSAFDMPAQTMSSVM